MAQAFFYYQAKIDPTRFMGPARTIVLGQPSEADTAQPIMRSKVRAVSQATETDIAQVMSPGKAVLVGQTQETDFAQAMLRRKIQNILQALETELAQALSHSKTVALALATETDTAHGVLWAPKIRLIGQVSEADLAQPMTAMLVALMAFGTLRADVSMFPALRAEVSINR